MAETIASPLGKAHPNATRIEALYASIRDHDAERAALCYRTDAHFEDIAFRLDGRERILHMWQLVCSREVQVSFDSIAADDHRGNGHWVARYTFGDTGRPVVSDIVSEFTFQGGLIQNHRDRTNAMAWARQAFPFPTSFLVGLVGPLRRHKAAQKLADFIKSPKA
jgi:hypothetical protein